MAGIPNIHSYQMPSAELFPSNLVEWRVESERAVLLIHDMQRFFVSRIPFENPGKKLIENCVLIRNKCLELNIPVAYTMQPGSMTEVQRGLLKDFWGPGMKVDPQDREVIDPLIPKAKDWLFTKWRYSAFHQSDLLQKIRNEGRDQLIICGVYAHIGILSTAIDSFSNDIETFLIADAVAAFSKEDHIMAINHAASCCAMILSTNEIVSYE